MKKINITRQLNSRIWDLKYGIRESLGGLKMPSFELFDTVNNIEENLNREVIKLRRLTNRDT